MLGLRGSGRRLFPPRIFVDDNAFAFFDVENPAKEPIDVAEIPQKLEFNWGERYDFLVRGTEYFKIGDYKGSPSTISATMGCIIFGAFTTDENGGVKSSGVYHNRCGYGTDEFQENLVKLVDTVRPRQGEITIKGIGEYGNEECDEYLQEERKRIVEILNERGVEIKREHLLFGGGEMRKTEFHPKTGQMFTYFSPAIRKTKI